MLRIEARPIEVRDEPSPDHGTGGGEGFLFLGVLTASWVIAIAIGWVIWRVSPL